MMKDNKNDTKPITLRSKKIRQLINDEPRGLNRAGYALTVFFLILILITSALIPFPYSQNGESILAHILGF